MLVPVALVGLGVGAIAVLGVLLLLAARRIRRAEARLLAGHGSAQAELDRREEYVAAIARELMNPIAAIAYAARALHDNPPGTDLRGIAAGIAAEAEGATQLVHALSDVARVEARHLHLALGPVDLVSVARDTVESFRPGAEHTVGLETSLDGILVTGDAAALAKVMRHLLSNAVTYSPPCRVRVEIDRGTDGRSAVLAVRDRGPGVPADERPLLFRKFARLSTAGGTVGAGLGLYVSRAIVEEHGGVLSAEWPSEGGSRFYFTVPVADGAAP